MKPFLKAIGDALLKGGLELGAGVLEEVLESNLEARLQKLHDTDKEAYAAVCAGLKLAAVKLKPLAEETKTGIDDALLDGILDAVNDSEAANKPAAPAE